MKMRVDGVEGLRRSRRRDLGRIDRICGIGDGGNCLVDSILMNGLDHIRRARVGPEAIGYREPLIKPAIPRTQHSLWRLLAIAAAQRVGQRDPRRPIALIVNTVLRFPTQPVAKSKTWIDFPVVLVEERGIEENRARGILIDLSYLVSLGRVGQILGATT